MGPCPVAVGDSVGTGSIEDPSHGQLAANTWLEPGALWILEQGGGRCE